jgi:hypothetical protein
VRLLVLTPFIPDPHGRHGGAVYLGAYLAELGRRAEVVLLSLASPGEAPPDPELTAHLAGFEAVPHGQLRDLRAGARCAHRARMLLEWGLRGRPLLAAKFWSRALAARAARRVASFAPDVVMLEQAVMAQYLPLFSRVPTVLTDHERGDPPPAEIARGGVGAARDARLWRRFVRAHYARASLVQALTVEDARHLAAEIGRPVEVRPLVVRLPERVVDPARAPPRALFLGNYLHAPNIEAARWLGHRVWPEVRAQHAGAELWLAGAHVPPEVQALHGQHGVRVVGPVEDLAALFAEVRMLLAPLFSGGGVRVKVLTAMAHGLGIVSNRLGLLGLEVEPPAATSAESPSDLAAAVIPYFEGGATAAAAGRAARAWIETHMSPAALAEQQVQRLARLIAEQPARGGARRASS